MAYTRRALANRDDIKDGLIMSAQWKYGCALVAAVVLAILFTQNVVRQLGASPTTRNLKMGRLMALEAKRQSAMELSREIQASRSESDDDAYKAFAIKLQQVAFLTPAEEVERNTLRDELNLPSASLSDQDLVP